jgi:oxaloacetate decarboxylase gamma subunit
MTILDMLGQSAVLTGLGIGVVFAFLIIMVFCLNLVHRIVRLLKLDAEPKAVPTGQDTERLVAAIAAALLK